MATATSTLSSKLDNYHQFIASKRASIQSVGFDVPRDELNPMLFPWQRDVVRWALRRGRCGVFPDTGLGKTLQQLSIADEIHRRTGGNFLILTPLAVSRQTLREAEKFKIQSPVKVCTSQQNVEPGITIINYEKLHKLDVSQFIGVALDEAGILKSVDGKTRDRLIEVFQQTPYRFCFTATPSPNDIMEIGSYAEFLGIMTRAEMLAMFFTHDGGETAKWRLKGHAEQKFFQWMAGWAVMLRKPSDIGHDDTGYDLPPLNIHEHVVAASKLQAGYLVPMEARTLGEQRAARRDTIASRTELLAGLTNAEVVEPWVVWCSLNDESAAAAKYVRGAIEITGAMEDWKKEQAMYRFLDQKGGRLISKVRICGFGMNLQFCNHMAFLGIDHSFEAFYQAVRRIWRFGQVKPCDVHVIVSDRDGAVLTNLKRKQIEHDRLMSGMIAAVGDFSKIEIESARRDATEYHPTVPMITPAWLSN